MVSVMSKPQTSTTRGKLPKHRNPSTTSDADSHSTNQTEYSKLLDCMVQLNKNLSQFMEESNDRFATLEKTLDPKPVTPAFPPTPVYNLTLPPSEKQFLKDPLGLHRSLNPDYQKLGFDGSNFLPWTQALNQTLDYVFKTENFLDSISSNSTSLSADFQAAVLVLLRATIDANLRLSLSEHKKPGVLFAAICTRCKRTDRQGKLRMINMLKEFYIDSRQPESTTPTVVKFQKLAAGLIQLGVTIDELLGLILQSVIVPPIHCDPNAFRNDLDHRLDSSASPPSLFSVIQTIQQIESESISHGLDSKSLFDTSQPEEVQLSPQQVENHDDNCGDGGPHGQFHDLIENLSLWKVTQGDDSSHAVDPKPALVWGENVDVVALPEMKALVDPDELTWIRDGSDGAATPTLPAGPSAGESVAELLSHRMGLRRAAAELLSHRMGLRQAGDPMEKPSYHGFLTPPLADFADTAKSVELSQQMGVSIAGDRMENPSYDGFLTPSVADFADTAKSFELSQQMGASIAGDRMENPSYDGFLTPPLADFPDNGSKPDLWDMPAPDGVLESNTAEEASDGAASPSQPSGQSAGKSVQILPQEGPEICMWDLSEPPQGTLGGALGSDADQEALNGVAPSTQTTGQNQGTRKYATPLPEDGQEICMWDLFEPSEESGPLGGNTDPDAPDRAASPSHPGGKKWVPGKYIPHQGIYTLDLFEPCKYQSGESEPVIAARKAWPKFGAEKGKKPGPDSATTSFGQVIQFVYTADKAEGEDATSSSLLPAGTKITCRVCRGDHFTANCPYRAKDTDEAASDVSEDGAASQVSTPWTQVQLNAAKYVPQSKNVQPPKPKGGGKEKDSSQQSGKPELYTLRVTNLAKDVRQSDVWRMFNQFGKVAKVGFFKNPKTGLCKGSAQVSFKDKAQAERAMSKTNGLSYKDLILGCTLEPPQRKKKKKKGKK